MRTRPVLAATALTVALPLALPIPSVASGLPSPAGHPGVGRG